MLTAYRNTASGMHFLKGNQIMKKQFSVLLVAFLLSVTCLFAGKSGIFSNNHPAVKAAPASSISSDRHCAPPAAKGTLKECRGVCDPRFNFSKVDSLINKGLADSAYPGAVLYVGYKGSIIYKNAFGHFTYDKNAAPMKLDAMFDMASVTKVMATTTAAMLLCDEGKLQLDKKVCEYLPEFGNNGKENVTIRNLLLHNSGLPPFKPFYQTLKTREEERAALMNMKPDYATGTQTVYSCLGMITLQQVIEKITGESMDKFLTRKVYKPIGMLRTMYNPAEAYIKDCVPTEKDDYWRMTVLQGKVHDEAAYLLGGVSGNAGLFSTGKDISIFLQMLLQKGSYNNHRYIKPETVEMWTKVQNPANSTRGLGWDTKSPEGSSAGHLFSADSYGHTGFTGTSVWVDPERELFAVLLTNRVHPTRNNNKLSRVRSYVHDAIVEAVTKK